MTHRFRYATLETAFFDVPAGTEVIVVTRFYGGIEGKCCVHVQPHPANDCDWSTIAPIDETSLKYTGKIWNYDTKQFEFES